MSDKSSKEKESSQKFDIDENDDEEKNALAKEMNDIEKENDSILSLVNNNEEKQNSTLNNSTIMNLNNELKEKIFLHAYKDKIPEIRIKDEDKLINGEKIEIYLNSPFYPNLKNNIYNMCENCGERKNYIFCERCFKNICDTCLKDCIQKHQDKLIKWKIDEIIFYKGEIKKVINEHIKKLGIYSNDIILINLIINNNYNNYFHYKNIKNCYKYLKKKYDINDQILIEYKINSNTNKIQIFGNNFVLNNKNKCFIIYENREFELMEFFELKNNAHNNILKIKLIDINNFTNLESMFYNCFSLIYLPDITKLNIKNVIDMHNMFYNCSSLISVPDISKWNTCNVTNMSGMFSNCSSLISLPDISKWNTSNVTNMLSMFSNCSSLISLPDISKWNTNKVTCTMYMFSKCSSLVYLPGISKWNTNNICYMENMFSNCSSLISLPDISKWNTNEVVDMSSMFYNCSSLISLPDISKWNTNNINYKNYAHFDGSQLIPFTDISKWNINKTTDIFNMFYDCFSLISFICFPDISKIKKSKDFALLKK